MSASVPLIINGATSQYDRWLKALDVGYAPVDGRSFSDMLQFAVDFGGLINFFNLEDEVEGDWVDFYRSDPLVIIASIEAIKLDNLESHFYRLIEQTQEIDQHEIKFSLLNDCFQFIMRLVQQINDWMTSLDIARFNETTSIREIELLKNDLELIVTERLTAQFKLLNSYAKGSSSNDALRRTISLETSTLLPIWGKDGSVGDDSIYRGNDPQQKINHASEYLKPILSEFCAAIHDLKSMLTIQSTHSISSKHRPQIALLMAFIKLYQKSQNTINTMSERYVRFYYDEVLRERKQKARADSLYLSFTLAEDETVLSTLVPAETLFSAGQDDNEDEILYAADRALTVTAASIGKIQTLHLDRGRLFSSSATIVTKRLIASDISLDQIENNPDYDWPIFGNATLLQKQQEIDDKVSDLAQLGFAIATSYLWLSGGERQVLIDIQYTKEYAKTILQPFLQELAMVTGLAEEDIFFELLENAFTLYASSSEQIFNVENYSICSPIDTGGNADSTTIKLNQSIDKLEEEPEDNNTSDLALTRTFRLCFSLPQSAPPLVPYVQQDDDSDESNQSIPFSTEVTQSLPILLAYLRQQPVTFLATDGSEINVYPLSLIDKMMVERIQVASSVKGLTGITLSNTDGEIDPGSPFTVFGGLPVLGSYLEIYQQELFVKIPQQLKIKLEWFNIPQNDTGFKGYYRYYDIDINGNFDPNLFDNQTFHGSFSLVNQGIWRLQTTPYQDKSYQLPDHQVYLFSSKDEVKQCTIPPMKAKPLCRSSLYDNFATSAAKLNYAEYYDPAKSAIRLELTAPDYAFGNNLYAKNVLNAVIEDLPDTDLCRGSCLCENQPINEAIGCLRSCLEFCMELQSDTEIFACIQKKLLLGESILCAAIIQRLSECLSKYNGLLNQEIYQQIRVHIERCMGLSSNERVKAIRQCFNTLKEHQEKFNQSEDKLCWAKFIHYFEALEKLQQVRKCVESCQPDSSEEYKACLDNCLQVGLVEMQAFYEICLTNCMDNCMEIQADLKFPNEPYLPQAVDVKVDYNAIYELFNSDESVVDLADQITVVHYFHLLPFNGYREVNLNTTKAIPLLANYSQVGNLYIGLSNFKQAQQLRLLFEMVKDKGENLPEVRWDLLSNNRWRRLSVDGIESDTTNGLQNTGVVSFNLPEVEQINNTMLENTYCWLRASTKNLSNLFPDAHRVVPHVLTATRVINSTDSDVNTQDAISLDISEDAEVTSNVIDNIDLSTGVDIEKIPELFNPNKSAQSLSAHTITSSVEDLPDIADIDQPLASFGGRTAESYRHFKIRMGERLRHKDRAILAWDYERLVLEEFPLIWKVIALPAHNLMSAGKPGEVLLVVVNGPDSINVQDPTVPSVPYDVLTQIKNYIQARSSLFLKLHLSNPIYVRIAVTAEVSFNTLDGYKDYRETLNNELVEYLSPWFYSVEREKKAGDYASKDDIAMFVQSRDYVNSLQSIEFDYVPKLEDLASDWCFLTSAKQHAITSNHAVNYEEAEFCY